MPVRSFALLICGVLCAAALTIAVAFAFAGLVPGRAGSLVLVALLVAAAVMRRVWR